MAHGLPVERVDGHGDDVVAVDHARLGEAFVRPDLDLGADAAGRSSDRCTPGSP